MCRAPFSPFSGSLTTNATLAPPGDNCGSRTSLHPRTLSGVTGFFFGVPPVSCPHAAFALHANAPQAIASFSLRITLSSQALFPRCFKDLAKDGGLAPAGHLRQTRLCGSHSRVSRVQRHSSDSHSFPAG